MTETFYGEIVQTPIDNTLTLVRCWEDEILTALVVMEFMTHEAPGLGLLVRDMDGRDWLMSLLYGAGVSPGDLGRQTALKMRKAKEICGG